MKLSERGVVTSEALLAYARNELTASERQELEKLLQEDPFALEALEGLQTTKDEAIVANTILNVNRKVRERTGLKEKSGLTIHWTNYAWAAVVFALLIAVSFVLINFLGKKGNHPVAKVEEMKEAKPAPAVLQPAAVSTDSATAKKDTTALVAKIQATGALQTVSPSGTSGSAKGAIGSSGKAPAAGQQNQPAGSGFHSQNSNLTSTGPAGASTKKDKTVASATTPATFSSQAKPPVSPAPAGATDNAAGSLDAAMKSFNSGDYKNAGDEFDKILKHDPDNTDALYFGAISDYISNKTGKSEVQFDKVLKKGNKYTDGAKWYKANILLKKGDMEHAKTILQELSNSNNPYKERAIKKMAEIGF